jgi:RNA polymerase sigma factor (sigma-70 family)
LQRIPMTQWSRLWALDSPERREFIRAIDAVKKRVQRERKRSPLNDNDLPAAIAERQVEERAAVNMAAATLLSPRQQRIVQMICDGWTIPDMAQELAIPVQRVSDEKYKAIQKLRAHFQGADEVRI